MTVLRSGVVTTPPPPPPPPPPNPSAPAMPDPPPPRRRSLRLAAASDSSPVPTASSSPTVADGSGGKRKRVAAGDHASSPSTDRNQVWGSRVSAPQADGVESDPGAPLPRRRSLRLAAVSNSCAVDAPSPSVEASGEMAGVGSGSRVSDPQRGGESNLLRSPPPRTDGDGLSPAVEGSSEMAGAGYRVSEPVDSVQLESEKQAHGDSRDLILPLRSSAEAPVEGGRVNLRSESQKGIRGDERYSYGEKGKGMLVCEVESLGNSRGDGDDGVRIPSKRRYGTEEKGKGKLVDEKDWLSMGLADAKLHNGITKVALEEERSLVGKPEEQLLNVGGSVERRETGRANIRADPRREADRNKAIELAPKFAYFKADDDGSDQEEDPEGATLDAGGEVEDWPGPFSTAMKIIDERQALLKARELGVTSKKDEPSEVRITWIPAKDQGFRKRGRTAPSLREKCMKVLVENADEIESLEGLPDPLKLMLVRMLCHSRKMSVRALGLLVSGSPTRILLTDCTWATEEQMERALSVCNYEVLQMVQLDMCGPCMTDYVLRGTLARSLNCLPSLTTLSLKGAYRLTDDGLNTIASSAPSLSSINLSQCSLLTSRGVTSLTDKLASVLRELYIDDCQNVDAMLILPALKRLQHLEVLSVARVQTVCDKFVKTLIPFSGQNMKAIMLAGCCKLSPVSVKVIGENCSQLCALDLGYLNRLNDSAIGYIANGCRSLRKLKLRRNRFSDEATAAFLEASGEALTELSLNGVAKVGQHTAIAISRRCSNLRSLDLSYCRLMTDEGFGLIADSCPNLKILKLFGCTQVTDLFLDGHSNSLVKIIGLKGAILEELELYDIQ